MKRDDLIEIVHQALKKAIKDGTCLGVPEVAVDAILAAYPALGEQGFDYWWREKVPTFGYGTPPIATANAAFTAGQAQATVTVLPLEWMEGDQGTWSIWATTKKPFEYEIIKAHAGYYVDLNGSLILGEFETADLAKAAAFTHHDAAVRSMIGGAS